MTKIDRDKITKSSQKYLSETDNLLETNSISISEILNSPHLHEVEGVYLISTPNDNQIVYVGRTKTKTIAGRIKDHQSMQTTSDLRGMLKLFPDYPQEIDDYRIRYKEITDERERTFFESFTIGILKPPFNK